METLYEYAFVIPTSMVQNGASQCLLVWSLEEEFKRVFSTRLTEVSNSEAHPCQLLPDRFSQAETQRTACADGNAEQNT